MPRDEHIVAGRIECIAGAGAAKQHVIAAGVAQVVRVRPRRRRVVADDELREDAVADRIGAFEDAVAVEVVELPARVDLEDEARNGEHIRWQMRGIGVAHDHAGKGVVLHFAEQVQAVEALQVIEAVAALQVLHLHFEDEVEGGAEHAAERHDLLGEAADPQVDIVEAAKRTAGIAPVALRKASRSALNASSPAGSAGTTIEPKDWPVMSASAASRLPSIVVWPVIRSCVP